MTTTEKIVNEFNTLVDITKEYDIKELKKILADICKANGAKPVKKVNKKEESDEEDNKVVKKGRPTKAPKLDKDGNEKAKRAPSAYNLYVKENVKELKGKNPEKKAKDLMSEVATMWKALSDEEKKIYKDNNI